MRILLVKPSWFRKGAPTQVRYSSFVRFPPLGLGIIAALSEGHDVRIVDADREALPLDTRFDLVGITVTTFASDGAFVLARHFRQRGARVVLGGVHASIMPEECLRHADAVVVGEVEYIWQKVLEDAAAGRLAGTYRADRVTNLRDVPSPRRDLMNEPRWFTCVEATRGCPNKCRYCYLPSVPWHVHRKRPLEAVDAEIGGLRQKSFMFVDENLFADREYARELFLRIARHRKFWLVQVPTNISGDAALLDAMQKGGCFNVQVGFQSFNTRVLYDAAVGHNRVERYREFVRELHARRIVVSGFFLFGFDADTPDVFAHTVEAIKKMGVDDATLFVLTPFPGTSFHEQFEAEGRLLPVTSRVDYGWSTVTFRPRNMTAAELEAGVRRAYRDLYPHFTKRLFHVLRSQATRLASNPRFAAALVGGNLTRPGI
jgi:radical SAM superfamily enzyme YgiQ (UPF0313 family)